MPTKAQAVTATQVTTSDQSLIVVTGRERYEIAWEQCSEKVAQARPEERRLVRLSPSGYGIYWPLLDEDLAVEELIYLLSPVA